MTNRQTRACCYGVMLIIVAVEWTMVGAGLFMALMDFVFAPPREPVR
jgi:hypothetical protein